MKFKVKNDIKFKNFKLEIVHHSLFPLKEVIV